MKVVKITLVVLTLLTLGCTKMKPIYTVPYVDINRFMGDWYVIANIPTFLEKDAYNAIESYSLAENGTIKTVFTFNKGSFDGPLKRYTPRGFIQDKESNALWGMQFIWPIKAEFRIIYLTTDYSQTVIGRTKRDYVWIMSRTPAISEQDYNQILLFLKAEGYDINKVQKVPHSNSG